MAARPCHAALSLRVTIDDVVDDVEDEDEVTIECGSRVCVSMAQRQQRTATRSTSSDSDISFIRSLAASLSLLVSDPPATVTSYSRGIS